MGAYFGGYIKPANHRENRRDRRLGPQPERQAPVRGRNPAARRGKSCPPPSAVRGCRLTATSVATSQPAPRSWPTTPTAGTTLHAHYVVKRINHQLAYSMDGACTNGAESFFSRLRRAEQGHHHHIAGIYLARYAQESAWREGHRRQSNGDQARGVVGLALAARTSVDFCGYWQRACFRQSL